MKIGVTQIVLPDMSLTDVISLCHAAQYEVVELFFRDDGEMDINMDDDSLQAIKQRLADAGIQIASVLAWYNDRGNFLSLDPDKRLKARRNLSRAIHIASVLDVGTTLLHPGMLEGEGTYMQLWRTFVGDMREMALEAALHQVTIAVENVWNRFMLSPKEAVDLVDDVGHPNFRIYFDTANVMAYGYPEQWIRDLGDRIAMVHFKDFVRREHRFVDLTAGDTDWAAVMQALRDIGYGGPVIHEVPGDRDKQIQLAAAMRRIVAM